MPQQQKADPTPEQIAERCLRIQATWTPAERMRRLRVDLRPTVSCADGRHVDVDASDYDEHLANHEALQEAAGEGYAGGAKGTVTPWQK